MERVVEVDIRDGSHIPYHLFSCATSQLHCISYQDKTSCSVERGVEVDIRDGSHIPYHLLQCISYHSSVERGVVGGYQGWI